MSTKRTKRPKKPQKAGFCPPRVYNKTDRPHSIRVPLTVEEFEMLHELGRNEDRPITYILRRLIVAAHRASKQHDAAIAGALR